MLDLALLGLLNDQPLHGYELKKQLAEVAGARAGVSFGSLYPALGRLEGAGLVHTVSEAPAARSIPMTGSLGAEVAAVRSNRPSAGRTRRTRKVYAITPTGQQRLDELLLQPATDDRTFQLQVAFCQQLSTPQRIDLFERRRIELLGRTGDIPQPLDQSDRSRNRYRRALHAREDAAVQAELSWLEQLLTDERQLLGEDPQTPSGAAFAAASTPATTTPSGGSTP